MKTPTKNKKQTATDHKLMTLLQPPQTRDGLVELCASTTRLTLERDAAQVKLDRRILDLQEAAGPAIDSMTAEIERSVTLINLWAVANRAAEFGERQGIEVAGCLLEFRKGTGKVECDVDEEQLVAQIEALPEGFDAEKAVLVRKYSELNKKGVAEILRKEGGAALLNRLGVRVITSEQFKFTPAREELAPLAVAGEKTPCGEAAAA